MTWKKFLWILLSVACIAAAGWSVWYFLIRQPDEVRIKNTLEQVRLCLIKTDPHETPITAALQVGAIKKQMTTPVSISAPCYGLNGEIPSDVLVKRILLAHKLLARIDVRFDDVSVRFPAEKSGTAEVRLSAVADYMERSGHYTKKHSFELTFCKRKNDWIICCISDAVHGKEQK